MRPGRVARLLLVVASVSGCTTVAPKDVVGGWEGNGNRGYAFASPSFGGPVNGPFSWLVRGTGSYLYYDVPAPGRDTEVTSPGGSLGLALRYEGPQLTATLGSGYEVRDIERRFADGSRTDETESGANAQADVYYQATPRLNLSGLVSFGDANDYTWGRVAVKRRLDDPDDGGTALQLGLEGTLHGNRDVMGYALGLVFEVGFGHASLQLRSGYLRSTDGDGNDEDEAYVGLGFYRSF